MPERNRPEPQPTQPRTAETAVAGGPPALSTPVGQTVGRAGPTTQPGAEGAGTAAMRPARPVSRAVRTAQGTTRRPAAVGMLTPEPAPRPAPVRTAPPLAVPSSTAPVDAAEPKVPPGRIAAPARIAAAVVGAALLTVPVMTAALVHGRPPERPPRVATFHVDDRDAATYWPVPGAAGR